MMVPAPIRCKNPGAMWGRLGPKPEEFYALPEGPRGCKTNASIPKKWGSKDTIYLSDGLGQNNNIAIFTTWVDGICAQIDLWRTKPAYKNQRFEDAIAVWSGHNNTEDYIAFVLKRVPGMLRGQVMNDEFLRSPMGAAFLRAQAWHEAGVDCPVTAGEWAEAQRRIFAPTMSKTAKVGTVIATGAATAAGSAEQAAKSGMPGWEIALIVAGIALVVGAVVWFVHKTHKGA